MADDFEEDVGLERFAKKGADIAKGGLSDDILQLPRRPIRMKGTLMLCVVRARLKIEPVQIGHTPIGDDEVGLFSRASRKAIAPSSATRTS